MSAIEAKSQAQALAFAPFSFQAAMALRDLGILEVLGSVRRPGLPLPELAERAGVSEYGVSVLLDFGEHLGLVEGEEGRWALGKVGYFFLHDEMTRVNADFTHDICYDALRYLTRAVRTGQPAGLSSLGPWDTLYQGLSSLPEPARSSWFNFDHLYSDRVFSDLLPLVFDRPVQQLLDVGGNTGRWARCCLEYSPDVHVTMVDLPVQLERAAEEMKAAGWTERVEYHAADLLSDQSRLPAGADVIWMSQFLDCFSADQIVSILRRARQVMGGEARLFIIELFPDRQAFDAAAFSLDATSLYFTCVANGNSRMYRYAEFARLLEAAGLEVVQEWDGVGVGHTALYCRPV